MPGHGPSGLRWPGPRPAPPDNRHDRDNCRETDRARDREGCECGPSRDAAARATGGHRSSRLRRCRCQPSRRGSSQTARSAPTGLGQRRGVHVGIQSHRHSERPLNCPGKIEIPPASFWRGRDVTESGRFRIRIDGAEGSDSDGRHRLASSKELDTCAIVSSGVVVGNSAIWVSSGPLPVAHRNFDPPASIPPTRGMSPVYAGLFESGDWRAERQPGTIKASMKLSAFARVLALSGLAAAAIAQQPSPATPAKPPAPVPPALTQVNAPESNLVPDAVVLTVGNQTMTRAQFEVLLSALAQNGRPAATPAQKRQWPNSTPSWKPWLRKPRKRKLDESAEVKQMMAIQGDSFLANALAKKISDDTHFTELDLRSYYDSHKGEFEEAQGSHILIRFKGSSVPLKPNEKDLTRKKPWPRRRTFASKFWRAPISPRWPRPNRMTRVRRERRRLGNLQAWPDGGAVRSGSVRFARGPGQ